MDATKKINILTQASVILRSAKLQKHSDSEYFNKDYGVFLMLRNVKESGRTYYRGINVQNMPKDGLRLAVLGKHHEYDLRSCATVWKYDQGLKLLPNVKFIALEITVTQKNDMFKAIADEIFHDVSWKVDGKLSVIKRIVNSIGFGARFTSNKTYKTENGYERVALYDLFFSSKRPCTTDHARELYDRCRNHNYFIMLQEEHDTIAKAILANDLIDNADLKQNTLFKNEGENTRFSLDKYMAFKYQSYETQVMDYVRQLIDEFNAADKREYGKAVIANIHDAIVTNTAIDIDSINQMIKKHFNNKFLSLNHTQNDGWQPVINHAAYDAELAVHKALIAHETARARGYIPFSCTMTPVEVPMTMEQAVEAYWERDAELRKKDAA